MKPSTRDTDAVVAPLLEEAEKLLACVHCGFCLTACPTFTRVGLEGDSPRGRLDLMRAVVEGRIPPDDEGFTSHIDRCLGCRACETACPAGVQYGTLVERARTTIARAQGTRFATRMLLATWGNPVTARIAGGLGRILLANRFAGRLARALPESWGLPRFGLAMMAAARPWRRLRTHARLPLPPATAMPPAIETDAPVLVEREVAEHPALAAEVQRVVAGGPPRFEDASVSGAAPWRAASPPLRIALLTGCVQGGLLGRINDATRRVLEANGAILVDAPGQQCCGALHAHSGALQDARDRARRNIAAFEAAGVDRVVTNAAGCGAMMKEYGELLRHDPTWAERAHDFSSRVRDLFELLAELGPRVGAPLRVRAAYDAPCHLYHAQRITRLPLDIMATVPSLQVVPIPDFEECCGGAGIYGIQHPELGGRVLADKLAAIDSVTPDLVITPNPGCHMQIGAGMVLRGDERPVLHPVELIDESYRRAGFYNGTPDA